MTQTIVGESDPHFSLSFSKGNFMMEHERVCSKGVKMCNIQILDQEPRPTHQTAMLAEGGTGDPNQSREIGPSSLMFLFKRPFIVEH